MLIPSGKFTGGYPAGREEISHEPSIKSTSAAEELEAKQREIERLRAEKDALAFMQPVARKRTPQFKASFNVSRET